MDIEHAYDVRFKHIGVVIVWNINGERPAYYMQFLRKYGEWIGNTKTLIYLREAYDNVRRNGSNREGL